MVAAWGHKGWGRWWRTHDDLLDHQWIDHQIDMENDLHIDEGVGYQPREPSPPVPEPHQPSDDEEQDKPKELPKPDRVALKRPRELTRADAYAGAGKRPWIPAEEEINDDDLPDLGDYLSRFDTSVEDDIKLCRTYASYLATTIKSVRGDAKKRN